MGRDGLFTCVTTACVSATSDERRRLPRCSRAPDGRLSWTCPEAHAAPVTLGRRPTWPPSHLASVPLVVHVPVGLGRANTVQHAAYNAQRRAAYNARRATASAGRALQQRLRLSARQPGLLCAALGGIRYSRVLYGAGPRYPAALRSQRSGRRRRGARLRCSNRQTHKQTNKQTHKHRHKTHQPARSCVPWPVAARARRVADGDWPLHR